MDKKYSKELKIIRIRGISAALHWKGETEAIEILLNENISTDKKYSNGQ